jgi:hypothetical protein
MNWSIVEIKICILTRKHVLAILLLTCMTCTIQAQGRSSLVGPLLEQNLQTPSVVSDELSHFMLQHVPPLVVPGSAQLWDQQTAKIRAHELSVLYHGWPQNWVDSPTKFEEVSRIERPGYRIIKLRFEVVPGFYSVALLYEPTHLSGKMPAILNVNGHGTGGKAV